MGGCCVERGGTLAEVMVAVAVVVVVFALVSMILGTASRVTGLGGATSDVLQEIAATEREIRADFERISHEGFFAIRCVAVPNDVNAPGPLLNPALGPKVVIRADQLVFFVQGVQSIQTYRVRAGTNRQGQSTVARVYYGHAFQAPTGPGGVQSEDDDDDNVADVVWAIDPDIVADDPLVPWFRGPRNFVRTRFQKNATAPPGDYVIDGSYEVLDCTQPPARQWILARQAVALADDGGSPAVFLFTLKYGGFRSTARIDDAAVRNGRVDAAAGGLGDTRAAVLDGDGDGAADAWSAQRGVIADAVFYPRAERAAPSMHRVDQALTNHVLASACSSFVVEWTYDDGVGAAVNPHDESDPYRGVPINSAREHPWFGLESTFSAYVQGLDALSAPRTIDPASIERFDPPETAAGDAIQEAGAEVYEAVFGYNATAPLDPRTGEPWAAQPDSPATYTPWPSALRITMTLHDAGSTLEHGRVVQFVVRLGP